MLKFISIVNLAVIQRLSIELHPGLCLLTGETGAGKSIIVDALSLLLGKRSGAGLIRTGESSSSVEGVFELAGESVSAVAKLFDEVGITFDAGADLVVRRDLSVGGRNRVFVNDRRVTASTLKALQPLLVEVLGQGEQYALASKLSHAELLDEFAGSAGARGELSKMYRALKEAETSLSSLREKKLENARLADYIRFQVDEINKINPMPGEEERLLEERNLLTHAERVLELCSRSSFDLYESDQGVLSRLAAVRKWVQELEGFVGKGGEWLELLEAASAQLSEVAQGVRAFGEGVDFSPARLGEIEERLAEIEKLKRKYGKDVSEILRLKVELERQLDDIGSREGREEELVRQAGELRREYLESALRLSQTRREAAPRLEASVAKELRPLALERAKFVVKIEPETLEDFEGGNAFVERETAGDEGVVRYTENGIDRVEFLFSANEGESPRNLSQVASGGELSRLLLALRTVCGSGRGGGAKGGQTLVFDEIDAGIGGRTADAVGARLKDLALGQQVLCVTHQAQIARFADHHYAVMKEVAGGRTITTVRELGEEERVGELARMIGGSEDVESARETARWMLDARGSSATGARAKRRRRA